VIAPSITEAVAQVELRIEQAAHRAGRSRDEITLIAVSKTMPAAALRAVYEAGLRHFGENYVQEFDVKRKDLDGLPDAVFHMIGHLQSNKANIASEMFDVIHTVDSERLARRLNDSGKPLKVLIEVKLSSEQSKTGVEAGRLGELIGQIRSLERLELRGLMVMPPWPKNPEDSRPYFRRLRELAGEHGLSDLSMGMSGDFEVAIEEGATLIRVGTAIFGPRKAKA
jgi:PLP dependent protein